MSRSFATRPFRPGDAGSLEMLHRRAILALAGRTYTQAECESWAHRIRAAAYVRIATTEETYRVAQMAHGPIGGFCSYALRGKGEGQICGLYTDPDFQGLGIGSALVKEAEADLEAHDATHFRIDASLAALSFYQRFGYAEVSRSAHPTRGGLKIDIALMRKPGRSAG